MSREFDHEKLDVYKVELELTEWVSVLLEEIADSRHAYRREVCDQLDRACLSVLLNTAEGNGKRQRPLRAKFFDDARGSAVECAACLDAIVAKRLAPAARVAGGKNLLLRIVSMLTRLVNLFEGSPSSAPEDDHCESEP
ncbi:MAG: four helix bundle protein [Verrucomicrobia bacterium]|nr:four helix bundle protein [Verrucomicrobiota bacterium]